MNKLNNIHRQNGATMGERNGVSIALSYHHPKEELKAVRQNILLVDYSHFGMAEISGESAYELLNTVVAGDVSSIRDEQAMYSIILNDQGNIVTDLYLLCDDERFVLLSEWLTGDQLCEIIKNALVGKEDDFDDIGEIISLDSTQGILHIEGPYSWEIMSELYGMDVIGLPFQEHMHVDNDMILLRSGKHGEFSYKLIGDQDTLVDAWQQIVDAGDKYDLCIAGLDYQKQVRLENPCWEPGVLSDFSQCPIALQMQWTVRYDKEEFVGQAPLVSRLEEGVSKVMVGMMISEKTEHSLQSGDAIYFGDQKIGQLISGGYAENLDMFVGRTLLDKAYAWADIPHYVVRTTAGDVQFATSAMPFSRNFSFLVNPSEHSYVDPSRPKNLLEQLERQKQKEAQKAAEQAAQKTAE